MADLHGKVAFITGAARGQGRSHAVHLASLGADIIAVDMCAQIASVPYELSRPADLEETVRSVKELGAQIVSYEADVRDENAMQEVAVAGIGALGRVDIVLANAGISAHRLNEPDSWAAYSDTIAVNLHGVRNTVHAVVPQMIAQGDGGSIVITSSTQGLSGRGGSGSGGADGYVASKHAVVGLMRSWAHWLAEHSIRVNTVHPTGVRTAMVNDLSMEAFLKAPGSVDAVSNLLPVEIMEPMDISYAVEWLVSDAGRYVTGVALPVDAGFSIR